MYLRVTAADPRAMSYTARLAPCSQKTTPRDSLESIVEFNTHGHGRGRLGGLRDVGKQWEEP